MQRLAGFRPAIDDSSDAAAFRLGTAAENSANTVQTSQIVCRAPLYAAQHEADSLARRPAGHLDCHGSRRALDIAALPLGSRRRVRESGRENLFYYLGIFDHDAFVAGTSAHLNHSTARILRAQGLPDSARGGRIHAARIHHLLGTVALVSHGSGGVVCDEFRSVASVVFGALMVAERGGAILFSLARRAVEMACASY